MKSKESKEANVAAHKRFYPDWNFDWRLQSTRGRATTEWMRRQLDRQRHNEDEKEKKRLIWAMGSSTPVKSILFFALHALRTIVNVIGMNDFFSSPHPRLRELWGDYHHPLAWSFLHRLCIANDCRVLGLAEPLVVFGFGSSRTWISMISITAGSPGS
jgi:hypothetical protein